MYTLNEKYDFDPVMQQSPRLFDEHFCLPPMEDQGMLLAFKGYLKKTYSFRQSYLFGLQKAGFDTTVILATGLKPFWTRWGRGF